MPKPADLLKAIALNPTGIGETVKVTLTTEGGLQLVPLFEDGAADWGRIITLDKHQSRLLAARVMVDPEYAAAIVAAEILTDAKGKLGNPTIWVLLGLLSSLAFAAGATLY